MRIELRVEHARTNGQPCCDFEHLHLHQRKMFDVAVCGLPLARDLWGQCTVEPPSQKNQIVLRSAIGDERFVLTLVPIVDSVDTAAASDLQFSLSLSKKTPVLAFPHDADDHQAVLTMQALGKANVVVSLRVVFYIGVTETARGSVRFQLRRKIADPVDNFGHHVKKVNGEFRSPERRNKRHKPVVNQEALTARTPDVAVGLSLASPLHDTAAAAAAASLPVMPATPDWLGVMRTLSTPDPNLFAGLTPHPTTPDLWVLPSTAPFDELKTPELGWLLGLLSPLTTGHQFVGVLPQPATPDIKPRLIGVLAPAALSGPSDVLCTNDEFLQAFRDAEFDQLGVFNPQQSSVDLASWHAGVEELRRDGYGRAAAEQQQPGGAEAQAL